MHAQSVQLQLFGLCLVDGAALVRLLFQFLVWVVYTCECDQVGYEEEQNNSSEPVCCDQTAFQHSALNSPLLNVRLVLVLEERIAYCAQAGSGIERRRAYLCGWTHHHPSVPDDPSDVAANRVGTDDHREHSKWLAYLNETNESNLTPDGDS